jgi:heme-degrading monooxygenase HmoA
LLKRDRYVATNRFAVRQGKEAKFEKRWATRKSKLATLDGFKYFHLMRRVTIDEETGAATYDEGNSDESSSSQEGNYVSFTIWEKKSDFSAWRTGEAFKEAHGGTSIGAFVKTMVSSALVLKGAPKPAFYDGLLLQSITPESIPDTVDGWRSVDADGVTTLPAECFVACNQFFVPSDGAAAFEQRWAQRESQLKECEGFVAFSMLRRDGQAKGHGMVEMKSDEPTYMSTTIWKDQASFQKWRQGTAFSKAHGQKPPAENKSDSSAAAAPPKPLWSRPPQPIFYEGTLVITREEGA